MSEKIVDTWVLHYIPLQVKWDWDPEKPDEPGGDYKKALDALEAAGIEVKYKTVHTVPCHKHGVYEGRIWVDKKDAEKAKEVVKGAGIEILEPPHSPYKVPEPTLP
jgi:hypothetical protein